MRNTLKLLVVSGLLIAACSPTIYNAPCTATQQCINIYTKDYVCENSHCIRRSFNFDMKEIIGFVFVFLTAFIANAGGLGAGPVLVPVYMLLFNFAPLDSIPLSKISIFAGATVNLIINWREKTKDKSKLLIDYRLASAMIPLILAGTMIGVILAEVVPSLGVLICLTLYLGLTIYKIATKVKSQTKKGEQEALLSKEKCRIMINM